MSSQRMFEEMERLVKLWEEGYTKQSNGSGFEKLTEPDKCECGKEKHGFAKHSTWCDIKDEE